MNIQRIFSLHLLLCSALFLQEIHSFVKTTTSLPGKATATFLQKRSGAWAIGSTATNNGDVILNYANPDTGTTETLSPVITVTGNANTSISALTVCDMLPVDNTNIRAVYVKSDTPSVLHAMGLNGNATTIDAGIILDAANQPTAGIVELASNETDTIMMAVTPNAQPWGVDNSGIALATLSDTAANTLAYVGKADNNTAAFQLDGNAPQVKAGNGNVPTLNQQGSFPVLHWCKNLNVWYVGIQGATGNTNGDAIKVLSAYAIEPNHTITSIHLVNNDDTTALGVGDEGDHSNIIGCTSDGTKGTVGFAILALDSMLTSTGRDYLIVQGGFGNTATASNKVFALPLVNTNGDIPGSLAFVDTTANKNVLFSKNAITAANLYNEASPEALVGKGPLPVVAGPDVVTQMMVIGDAVYCSVSTNATEDQNDVSGLYYSQAEFDSRGQIVKWSVWTQALPNEASGQSATDGSCLFFAVDAIEGKIWTIPTTPGTEVRVSQWEQPTATNTFVGSVNALLQGPCYCQLNLDKTTPNYFNVSQVGELAFFGGNNKVVVVKTATAQGNFETSILLPTSDWTLDGTKAVDISLGLENVGAINTLGWTATNNEIRDNYLLAGTNGGLYAFVKTDTEVGEDASDTQAGQPTPFATDAAPFDGSYSWKHIDAIGTDPVVKIITMGDNNTPVTFVLTHGARHKLWRLASNGSTTLADLNGTVTLVRTADTLDNSNGNACFFYDMVSIKGSNLEGSSTLLLATNTGLYKPDNPILGDVTIMNWKSLNLSNEFNNISSFFTERDVFSAQTVYYVRRVLRQAPGGGWAPEVKSSLGQISFKIDPSTYNLTDYYQALNGDRIALGNAPLAFPIKSFFTDGGRRFYIEQVEGDSKNGCTLHTVPFYSDSLHYGISTVNDLADPVILAANTFYWINNVGAGYLMAGTDNGVIALQ